MKKFIAVPILLAIAAASSANFVTNGNFETDAYAPPYQSVTMVTGWTVIGREVAGIKVPYLGAPNQEIDLSGVTDTTPGSTGLEQTISTVVGQSYLLKFDVFAGQNFTGGYVGGVDFYLNNGIILTDLEGNRATFTYSFVGTGSDTLRFMSHEGNVSHIDNVTLSTPAPGAMIAFALGAARLRRRK